MDDPGNVDGSDLGEDPSPSEEQVEEEGSENQEENVQEEEPQNEEPEGNSSFPDQSIPKISHLVNEALLQLKEPKGSTVEGIHQYLRNKYKVDPIKTPQNIRSYLKRAITKGVVQHVGGEGASARFKLTPDGKSAIAKAARDAAKAKGRPPTSPAKVSSAQKEVAVTPNGTTRPSVAVNKTAMSPLKRAAPLPNDGISKRKKTADEGMLVPHVDRRNLNPVPGKLQSSAAAGVKTNAVKKEPPTSKLGVRK